MNNKYSFRNILDNFPGLFDELYKNRLNGSPEKGRYKSNINLKGESHDRRNQEMEKKEEFVR